MEQKLFSLQGIIFQPNFAFGKAYDPDMGDMRATIDKVINQAMFYAVVGPDGDGGLAGSMHDKWGESTIWDFKNDVTSTTLAFVKQYSKPGRQPIFYEFDRKEGDVWIGAWKGIDCGEGTAKLLFTEIDSSFLEPASPGLLRVLLKNLDKHF